MANLAPGVWVVGEDLVQQLERGARGGDGVLGVERDDHHGVDAVALHLVQHLLRVRVPVPAGRGNVRVVVLKDMR